MLYGLYHSAQGAKAESLRLDAIANNLANASTTAFKKSLAVFQHHRTRATDEGTNEARGNLNDSTGGITVADIVTDFSQGHLDSTGVPLDIALAGPGFLQVADAKGNRFLTRNGHLAIDQNGTLQLADSGHRVLNAEGESIAVPTTATQIRIDADGSIQATVDGTDVGVGRLAAVSPASLGQLQRVGNSLYQTQSPLSPAGQSVQFKQGYLEGSSVNAIGEMKQMIETSRAFEMNTNMIRHQDESLARLLQSLPRR